MKPSLIATLSLLAASLAYAEEDPFANSAADPPRPERKITTLPKSVDYEVRDGSHVYVITGIFSASPEHDVDDLGSSAEAFIPSFESCAFDFKKLTCTIVTTRRLTYSELAYAIDDIAGRGGDLPYWAELKARDFTKSDEFADLEFLVKEFKGEQPKHVAWFVLPKDKQFEIPFGITSLLHFKVHIVPTTAYCMCHSRYCIRILDTDGKVVWKDAATAYAGVSVAVTASDDGFGHQLLIQRYHHGEEAGFIVRLNSEHSSAEQPATVPGSELDAKRNAGPVSEKDSK